MFSFGKWTSSERCHGSVLQAVSEGNFAVLFKFDGKFYAVVATVDVL